MTYDELLERWLDVKRLAVEPTTVSSYEWLARTYVRPGLDDRKLTSIRPIDLDGRPWRHDVCMNRFGRLRARLGLPRACGCTSDTSWRRR